MEYFALSDSEWTALALSFRVAGVATLVALPFAIGVAYLLARGRFWGKSILNIFTVLPLVLPPVVTGYALLILFGRRGVIGQFLIACCGISLSFRWTGAALAAAIMSFPLMVRSIRISFEAIDNKLESAAATLGAPPFAVFLCVTVPLALPGIFAAAILGFAKSLGEFGATIAFVANIPGETQTLSLAIYSQLSVPNGETAALRLLVLSLILAVGAVGLAEWLAQRNQKALRR